MSNKSIKLGGKAVKKKTPKPKKQGIELSDVDAEVQAKIKEMQEYLSAKKTPYFIVAQLPESKLPMAIVSFNASKDNLETMNNVEWMFTNVGGLLQQVSSGFLRLIKFY